MSSPRSPQPNPVGEFLRRRPWQDWFLLSVLIIGTLVLVRGRWQTLSVHRSLLIALLLLTAVLLFRGALAKLGGPMFLYDLFRTGRKGLGIGHRFLYGGFLLLALFLLYSSWFPYADFGQLFDDVRMDVQQMAKFAAAFFSTFLCVQVGAVLIVTPAYVAGSIAEEKQRRTLEFVLTTDLSNREVVLGVLGARLANLALLLLTGMPVLSLIQFLGGVDPLMVFTGFAVTLLTMFSLAGQSMLASVLSRRPLDSIVGTYFVAFFTELVPTVIVLSAMVGQWDKFTQPLDCLALLLVCAIYHGGVGLGCCALAVSSLRTAYLGTELPPIAPPRPAPRVAVAEKEAPSERQQRKATMRAVLLGEEIDGVAVPVPAETEPVPATERVRHTRETTSRGWDPVDHTANDGSSSWPAPPERRRPPPPVNFDYAFRIRPPCGDEPILWKETGRNFDFSFVHSGYVSWLVWIVAIVYIVVFLIAMAIQYAMPEEGAGSISNPLVRVLGTIGACVTLVILALTGSNKISREREQQTLATLLTTPLDSVEILFGKWFSGIWAVSPLIVILLLIWGMGVMTGGIHPASLPLLLAAYLVYACCLSTLGLYLSMMSRTTLRATLFTLLTSLVLVLGPGLLMRAIDGRPPSGRGVWDVPAWSDLILEYGFTPPLTLWTLAFNGDSVHDDPYTMLRIVSALIGLLAYVLVTVGMWASMLYRFRGLRNEERATEEQTPS